ncbi:MAG: hypothetical protein IKY68_05955 [Alistipes sp.]|nr:hypothetical protein [Alistipes sp.]
MQRILRILVIGLLWLAVAAYLIYAATQSRASHSARCVQQVRIGVLDSTAQGSLVGESEVRERLSRNGLKVEGMPLDSVPLQRIEESLLRNGFVERVRVYLTEEGVLQIDLSQRRPMLRLLSGEMDSYVTREGYIFTTPPRSSLYLPVMTGDYRPPIKRDFNGSLREEVDRQQAQLDSMIKVLEREKYPHYLAERQNDRRLDSVRRYRIKRHGFLCFNFESEEEFDERVKQTRAKKASARRHLRYVGRQIQGRIDRLSERQEALRDEQKKLEKYYEDFMKLLTFVEEIEKDAFWRSELVEICATRTSEGVLDLSFIPRSGSFVIRFGRLEEEAYKLEKLERFYRKGLPALGWERYREVDLRFSDRVVCR